MVKILHMSDFHLGKSPRIEQERLELLAKWLKEKNIKVDYVVFTGDVIDARTVNEACIFEIVQGCNEKDKNGFLEILKKVDSSFENVKDLTDNEKLANVIRKHYHLFQEQIKNNGQNEIDKYNSLLAQKTNKKFDDAIQLVRDFLNAIAVPYDQFIACCGNHDRIRRLSSSTALFSCTSKYHIDEESFSADYAPFDKFCKAINNKLSYKTTLYSHGGINFVISNTNWRTPVGDETNNMCIHCGEVVRILHDLGNSPENLRNKNIFVAHKPFDDFCENAKFPYDVEQNLPAREVIESTTAMFLYGDKHTYSVKDKNWLREYMCGMPLANEGVRYNLIDFDLDQGVQSSKFIVLKDEHWALIPIMEFFEKIYSVSKLHIKKYALELLGSTQREIINWNGAVNAVQTAMDSDRFALIEQLFASCVKLYDESKKVSVNESELFEYISSVIENSRKWLTLSVKGEPGIGKSTFLSIEYLYLLWRFYAGRCGYVPFYFDMDSLTEEVENKFQDLEQESEVDSLIEISLNQFHSFLNKAISLGDSYDLPICLIVDGLDTQNMLTDTGLALESRIYNSLEISFKGKKHKCVMGLNIHDKQLFENSFEQLKQFQYALFFSKMCIVPYKQEARYPRFLEAYFKLTRHTDPTNFNTILKKLRRVYVNLNFLNSYDGLLRGDSSDCDSWLMMRKQIRHMTELVRNLFITDKAKLNQVAFLMTIKGFTYQAIYEKAGMEDVLFSDLLKIRNNPDIAEFLVARHYIEELRKYTNSDDSIPPDSVLYCFITRDLAVKIRLQMEESGFQFNGLKRFADRHSKELHGHLRSTILYLAGHSKKFGSAALVTNVQTPEQEENDFFKLCAKRSQELSLIVCEDDHQELVNNFIHQMINNESYRSFHRSYQLHYYKDLSDLTDYGGTGWRISRSKGIGFDYNNCFLVLTSKLDYCFESNMPYPMMEIDLYTLCDLTYSRLQMFGVRKALFYSKENNQAGDSLAVAILKKIILLLDQYDAAYRHKRRIDNQVQVYFSFMKKRFSEVSKVLEKHPGESINKPFTPLSKDLKDIVYLTNQPRVGWNINKAKTVAKNRRPKFAKRGTLGMPRASWGESEPVRETIGQHILECLYIALFYLPEDIPIEGYSKSTVLSMLLMSEVGKLQLKADYSPIYNGARELISEEKECLHELLIRGAIDGYADLSTLFDVFTVVTLPQEVPANINMRICSEIKRIQMEYKYYSLYEELEFEKTRHDQFIQEFVDPETKVCKEIRTKIILENPDFAKYFVS